MLNVPNCAEARVQTTVNASAAETLQNCCNNLCTPVPIINEFKDNTVSDNARKVLPNHMKLLMNVTNIRQTCQLISLTFRLMTGYAM